MVPRFWQRVRWQPTSHALLTACFLVYGATLLAACVLAYGATAAAVSAPTLTVCDALVAARAQTHTHTHTKESKQEERKRKQK